jgi:zinc transporter ZupT
MRAAGAALLAVACAALATSIDGRGRWLAKAGGALLAAVALFGLLPELAGVVGWVLAAGLAAVGYALLAALDHFGVPVCPSCSHGTGYLSALIAAVAVHALVDGWSMVAVGAANPGAVSAAISTAIVLHKVPEGLALGALLQPAVGGRGKTIAFSALAELPTVIGGGIGTYTAPAVWVNYPLALAAGTFLFLGLHALRQQASR